METGRFLLFFFIFFRINTARIEKANNWIVLVVRKERFSTNLYLFGCPLRKDTFVFRTLPEGFTLIWLETRFSPGKDISPTNCFFNWIVPHVLLLYCLHIIIQTCLSVIITCIHICCLWVTKDLFNEKRRILTLVLIWVDNPWIMLLSHITGIEMKVVRVLGTKSGYQAWKELKAFLVCQQSLLEHTVDQCRCISLFCSQSHPQYGIHHIGRHPFLWKDVHLQYCSQWDHYEIPIIL